MSVSNRFHLTVVSATIGVAVLVSTYVTVSASVPPALAPVAKAINDFVGSGPFASLVATTTKALAALVGSAAFYQLLATVLRWVFEHIRFLRKFVYGSEFLEGTWIGAYGTTPDRRYTVEHFEETLDGVTVRGYAFTEAGALDASWNSNAVLFDSTAGTLTYSYNCDLTASKTSHQGIAVFNVERDSTRSAPRAMIGYSADLFDGSRTTNAEAKLSDKQISLVDAQAAARERF